MAKKKKVRLRVQVKVCDVYSSIDMCSMCNNQCYINMLNRFFEKTIFFSSVSPLDDQFNKCLFQLMISLSSRVTRTEPNFEPFCFVFVVPFGLFSLQTLCLTYQRK